MAMHSLVSSVVRTSGQVLPFNFLIYQADQLRVIFTDAAGDSTVLSLGADYTVPESALGRESGGAVTLVAGPLGAGEQVTIERHVEAVQELDLTATGALLPENIETALDLLTMLAQQDIATFLRALLLGDGDVDGSGSYRAKGNRIQDLANPVAGQDAVNRQTMEGLLQGAALGVPTTVPPTWEYQGPDGGSGAPNQLRIPGATLSNKFCYMVYEDGIAQLHSAFSIDTSTNPPLVILDHDIEVGITVLIVCNGYARPVDPAPLYDESSRPAADSSIAGREIRYRHSAGGPTLRQVCEQNSANGWEWLTLGVTT